jgi:Ca2+-binding EF-hand superfamily protein
MGKENSKLKAEEISVLLDNTHFSPRELQDRHKEFLKECPSGLLTMEQFKVYYSSLFPKGDSGNYAEHVFRTFDSDCSGTIDFKEFIIGLSVASRGNLEKKLKWAFTMYDLDRNGHISKDEMLEMIEAVFKMVGNTDGMKEDENTPEKKVKKLYDLMDKDNDEKVTLDEFIEGAKRDPTILRVLLGGQGGGS